MTSMTAELNAFMDSLVDRVDPEVVEIMNRNKNRLELSGIAKKAINVGDVAPDFTLQDQTGATVSLHETLARGPAVVVFVRGMWCPFCSITLRAFDEILKSLARAGATLLAISPATPENIRATAERNLLRIPVLADTGLAVAAAYGLVWEPDPDLQAVYARFGHDIPRINGTGDWRIPLPAGYVIGMDGIVHAARVEASVVDRLAPSTALAEVRALTQA